MSLRWNCEKQGCYKDECLPDWGCYDGCFPRGIRPTDVDGALEINGRFLFLEAKPSHSVTAGQMTMFRRLAALPDATVIIETRPASDTRDWLILDGIRAEEWQTITLEQAREWLEWWSSYR